MAVHIPIEARWLDDDKVWLATSAAWPGLVVEAGEWSGLLEEIELVLPDFLEIQGIDPRGATFTVKAEESLTLSPA
jgi:hypothetical protein